CFPTGGPSPPLRRPRPCRSGETVGRRVSPRGRTWERSTLVEKARTPDPDPVRLRSRILPGRRAADSKILLTFSSPAFSLRATGSPQEIRPSRSLQDPRSRRGEGVGCGKALDPIQEPARGLLRPVENPGSRNPPSFDALGTRVRTFFLAFSPEAILEQ